MIKMIIPFIKMHGAGNDFIVVDESRKVLIPKDDKPSFVKRVSDRHFGVGSDGVIFVQRSGECDARFIFFNPDGSLAEMCGNGVRCFAKYVYESGLARKNPLRVESSAGECLLDLSIEGDMVVEVRVDMGKPRLKRRDIPVSGDPDSDFINQRIDVGGDSYVITAVGMGNPHAVIVCEDVDDVDVVAVGGRIRRYTDLFPNGVNVSFIQNVGGNEFRIRTYERGVEDETLACGTGISASAVAAAVNEIIDPGKEVIFHALGGDLKVELKNDRAYLTGPVEEVFRGELSFDE